MHHEEPRLLPPSTTSYEPFTAHWAQLPEPHPPPETSAHRLSTSRSSFRRSTISQPVRTPPPIATTTKIFSTRSTETKSAIEASGDAPLSTLGVSSRSLLTTSAFHEEPTIIDTTSPAVGKSSHDNLLSGGATAAVVVSSILAFSLCGILVWLRRRHLKKRRAGEDSFDFSSVRSHRRDEGPMIDMRAAPSGPLQAGLSLPARPWPAQHTADSMWPVPSPDSYEYGAFTRSCARGVGLRAGEATLVELPGDTPVTSPVDGSGAPGVAAVRGAMGSESLSPRARGQCSFSG